jgi:O-antigen/teichoic acid export membrane protein
MRELLKAYSKTGLGSLASLCLGAVATKVIAVVLGPSGIGLFSLLRQTQQTAVAVGSINGQTALVQGLASRDGEQQGDFLVTVFWILMAACGITCAAFVLFPREVAHWVTGQHDEATVAVFRWLALPVLLAVVGSFLAGVLNAHRAIGRLALVQVASAMTMALVAYPFSRLVRSGNPVGFIWLLSASAGAALLLALTYASRERWLSPLIDGLRRRFKADSARHFLSMGITMFITGLVGTGTQLVVRSLVNRRFGLPGAGVFDVAWTLSMMYVTLVLGSFGTYYLPTLSRTSGTAARAALIQSVLRFSIFLMVPLVVSVVVLKPLVVSVLYSDEFAPSLSIIRWMLIGDYFKAISWVLAMPMVAYADMRTFFWSEMLWNGGLIGFAGLAVSATGGISLIGVGFLVLYVGYLAFTVCYTARRHGFLPGVSTTLPWALGLSVVVAASLHTWNDQHVRPPVAILWIGLAVAFSLSTLSRGERTELVSLFQRGGPRVG